LAFLDKVLWCFGLELAGSEVLDGELVRNTSSNDGVMRNMLKASGVEEYNVKAKSVAETLSKKSMTAAT
jgi:hypothetical protein